MKIPSLFMKTPRYKRFNYEPRWYDPQEERRKEREERIRTELKEQGVEEPVTESDTPGEWSMHNSRIAGSFKSSRRTASRQFDPSASLLRLIILTFLTIWLIAFIQFGNVALYGLLILIPFYAFLKLRKRAE